MGANYVYAPQGSTKPESQILGALGSEWLTVAAICAALRVSPYDSKINYRLKKMRAAETIEHRTVPCARNGHAFNYRKKEETNG